MDNSPQVNITAVGTDLNQVSGPAIDRDPQAEPNPTLEREGLVEPRTLAGFRDLLPGQAIAKSSMLHKLTAVYQSFGFVPIETPHLEYANVLLGKGGTEINKQVYRFRHGDPEGRSHDVALRFDLTVPLARFVVQHKTDIEFPFRRYAIGNVFRGEKPQAGRYREFTQCDFDIIGTESVSADAEIVQIMGMSMLSLGIHDFTIRINNRKLLNGVVEHAGALEKITDILRVIDKFDKVGPQGVREALMDSSDVGLTAKQADNILEFISLTEERQGKALWDELARYRDLNESLRAGVDDVLLVARILEQVPTLENKYKFDFTVARGLGYYTGTVFETTLDSLPKIGSVCSGGRFDNLTKSFSQDHLPGVGASVGLDRLISALQELGLVKETKTLAHIMFTQMDPTISEVVHGWAALLRSKGFCVEVYPDPGKLKPQLKYANRKGFEWVAIVGQDEASKGLLQLKNMSTGQQSTVSSVSEIADLLLPTGDSDLCKE